jgi:predicted AAA+ superfamily ATPase
MLFERKIVADLENYLLSPEYLMIQGGRRVGKTKVLKLIAEKLIQKYSAHSERVVYLDLSKMEVLESLTKGPEALWGYATNREGKNYFLLDNLHYLESAENFLSSAMSQFNELFKIIATTTKRLKVSPGLNLPVFTISPLGFEEFLYFKQIEFPEKWLLEQKLTKEEHGRFTELLTEYLLYGGLPEVVLAPTNQDKEELLSQFVTNFFNQYVHGRLKKILDFNQFWKFLALNISGMINIHEIENNLDIPRFALNKFLDFLTQNNFIYLLEPFHQNLRTEISKMNKGYFFDLGVRNATLNNFTTIHSRADQDQLFKNFLFLELRSAENLESLNFYRTTNGADIDFIAQKKGAIFPIEGRYQNLKRPRGFRSMTNFIQKKNSQKGTIVNLNLNRQGEYLNYSDYRHFLQSDFFE